MSHKRKAYVLVWSHYDESGVLGVFGNLRVAERVLRAYQQHTPYSDWPDIEEFALDSTAGPIEKGLWPYQVTLSQTDVDEVLALGYLDAFGDYPSAKLEQWAAWQWKLRCIVLAPSKTDAIAQAEAERARVFESGAWPDENEIKRRIMARWKERGGCDPSQSGSLGQPCAT